MFVCTYGKGVPFSVKLAVTGLEIGFCWFPSKMGERSKRNPESITHNFISVPHIVNIPSGKNHQIQTTYILYVDHINFILGVCSELETSFRACNPLSQEY